MRRSGALLLFVGCLGIAWPAYAGENCNPDSRLQLTGAADAPWVIQLQLTPKSIPLNAPFDANVTVCSDQEPVPTRITLDATMPAHKHGMNYEPKTERKDSHRYEVKNLLFHMPGIWRLEITAYENSKPHRFTHDVTIR